jgi:conjugative relaxase-like TrwC/TraI family protein
MMSNPQPIQDTAYLFKYVTHENDRQDSSWWFGESASFQQWHVNQHAAICKQSFVSLANGLNPLTSRPLVANAGRDNRRKGKEFSLSAPKSFGIAYEVADDPLKKLLDQCDRKATHAALEFIQATMLGTKDGQGRNQPLHSIYAAVFTHRTNRDNEILRHNHIELLNLAMDAKGKFRGVDFKVLFDQKKHIGALYRQVLANELMKLGFRIEPDRFSWRIAGCYRLIKPAQIWRQ